MSPEALQEKLEGACLDAMGGDPPGPLMASRLQRTCLDVLRRLGLGGARVSVVSGRTGTRVRVSLPPRVGRVQELVLHLG